MTNGGKLDIMQSKDERSARDIPFIREDAAA